MSIGAIFKAIAIKNCFKTSECQGDTKIEITLSKKEGIFRGIGILYDMIKYKIIQI